MNLAANGRRIFVKNIEVAVNQTTHNKAHFQDLFFPPKNMGKTDAEAIPRMNSRLLYPSARERTTSRATRATAGALLAAVPPLMASSGAMKARMNGAWVAAGFPKIEGGGSLPGTVGNSPLTFRA